MKYKVDVVRIRENSIQPQRLGSRKDAGVKGTV